MTKLSLPDLLEAGARSSNGITYVVGETKESFISYKDLKSRALILLGYFQKQGVSANQEMLILINKNEHFIEAYWACILGGIIPVPLSTGISDNHSQKIVRVFEKLRNPQIYTSKHELSRLLDYVKNRTESEHLVNRITDKSFLIEEITDSSEIGEPHHPGPDDLAFIQFSSGSTGEPKGVMLTHENLISNIQSITEGSNFTSEDKTFGWMPLTHDLGLVGFHLVPLASAANQILMPTELFVRRPMLWMQKSSEHQVTITCSPNFGYKHFLKYFNPDQHIDWNLSAVRLILNGAEPISASLCEEFTDALKSYGLPQNSMFPVYGLAEASLAVSFPQPGAPLETISIDRSRLDIGQPVRISEEDGNNMKLVKLGRPVPYCSYKIVDFHDNELPEQTIGRLKISGKNVTKGYYLDPETTKEIIKDNWLDTGDLAFIHQGSLVLTGRSKDIIFLNGQNLYPHDLEQLLDQMDELEIGKTAVTGVFDGQKMQEEPAVFVAFRGNLEEFVPLTKAIRGHLSAYTGLEVSKVFPVQTIPKTTSGKIQRFLLADQYHNGAFNEVEAHLKSMLSNNSETNVENTSEIEITLLDICKEFLSDDITANDNLFELGTSSLVLTQIHDRIDTLWPSKVELTDYFDYPTVSELAKYLEQDSD
ncbi:MAG: peptide synthetase [Cyclobacteriaceae bacterium]|nr:MAG: peptide synthetase [Cyclobacteriaceae bacterium]